MSPEYGERYGDPYGDRTSGADRGVGEPSSGHPAPFSRPDAPPYPPAGGWDGYWVAPYGYRGAPAAAPVAPPRSSRRGLIGLGVGLVAAAAVFGVAVAGGSPQLTDGRATTALGGPRVHTQPGGGASSAPGAGSGSSGSSRSGSGSGSGSGRSGSSTRPSSGQATPSQARGVVDIYSVQGYQQAAAAGTGMILTPRGRILTNNHVIDGATTIKATVVSTGRTYTARVVGTAPTKDVAVLQLQHASGLPAVNLGNSAGVRVGDKVTGVGNAGGAGGTPSAASGAVLALGKTISASDETGAPAEKLYGVIVTNAPIRSGDSGGPLYDASGRVIGMDTAASTTGPTRGFAIPINRALPVVHQIVSGVRTSSIHIGYPGFLAITMAPGTDRPEILQVIAGGPADRAGLTTGDVITAVNGTAVRTQLGLRAAIGSHSPGSRVSLTYRDPTGAAHTAQVTLAKGPAD